MRYVRVPGTIHLGNLCILWSSCFWRRKSSLYTVLIDPREETGLVSDIRVDGRQLLQEQRQSFQYAGTPQQPTSMQQDAALSSLWSH